MSPEDIKRWLKEKGRSQQWLAEACGVAYGTLSNQMGSGKFSKQVEATIRLLMESEREASGLRFTPEQWDLIERARAIAGYEDREEFFMDAILKFASGITTRAESPTQMKVAETSDTT